MLLKLRVLLAGITLCSICFGGVVGRYLEDDSIRFPDPYQMGPVSEFKAKLINVLENLKEIPEYDTLQKNDLVYPDAPEDPPIESLPKPLRRISNPAIQRIIQKEEKRKSNVRKAYMSPCHFKICNMGRKRNVAYLQY
ncbi:hypothetical protein ACFFRR_011891 [Megaselia abdita]